MIALLVVLCLAVWVLVQDFGFFGGLGTDPNSMIPMILLAVAAYLALAAARRPARPRQPAPAPATAPEASQPAPAWREQVRPRRAVPVARGRRASGPCCRPCAIGVILLGAVPMAAAQASPNASPILAEAIDGSSAPLHTLAPGFALTDQHGRPVSLASLRGKAVLLTFLDPVCVTDCPLEAQEFREAGVLLGARGQPGRAGRGQPEPAVRRHRPTPGRSTGSKQLSRRAATGCS